MSRDALVVGINTYSYNHLPNLTSPSEDAEGIAQRLNDYGDFRVQRLPAVKDKANNTIRVGKKTAVTAKQLEEALVQLFKPNGENIPETALFFFSGHGLRKDRGIQDGFLATSDVNPDEEKWGVRLKWLRELLQESPIPQAIVWLDCCYSGELLNFQESLQEADPGNLESKSRCFITACREFEVALVEPTGNFSILTKALLQGLDPSQQPDGWVTSHSLADWIYRELRREPQRPLCHNSDRTILLTNNQFKKEVGECPYKGLQYFDVKDGEFFYGRDALTDRLIDQVKNRNFIAVLGESGFGKSSVIRAGLLYRLKLGQVEGLSGSDRWKFYPPFAPGEHPLERLKEAIGREANELGELIASAETERVVLVVDQFEESFTLCQDHREREEFFDSLLDAIARVGNKLCLILGMRSDFLGECTKYAKLASQIKETENLVIVTPIDDPQELRNVIVEPAQKVGLQVEPRLVIKMIEDVKASPSRLPLLQDALEALWIAAQNQPDRNILTFSAYEELGGIEKTLEKRANQVYEWLLRDEKGNLLPEEEGIARQQIAKRIFWELTYVGEETEIKVTIKSVGKDRLLEFVTYQESSELVDRVIRELEKARLIVTNKAGVVGIAHQALIGNWEKLRQWVAENPEGKRKKQKIEVEAEEWEAKRKSKDYLLTGQRLVEAEGFIRDYSDSFPLSALEREFVTKSREESDRRRRYTIVGLIAALIVTTGFSILASWEISKLNG